MKRLLSLIFSVIFSVCVFAGCGGNGKKSGGNNSASPNGAPDYSDSLLSMNQYAFIGPTNGSFTTQSGTRVVGEDNRTAERYLEYKQCGFDVLLLLGNDGYSSVNSTFNLITKEQEAEIFSDSQLKRNLDLCEQVGLKTIVFDDRIHALSSVEKSIIKEEGKDKEPIIVNCAAGTFTYPFNDATLNIGDGKITVNGVEYDIRNVLYQYENEQELENVLAVWMSAYASHPAFYGVSTFDEPQNSKLLALGQVNKAIKNLYPNAFVQTCLLPYYGTASSILSVSSEKAFREYIDEYIDKTGSDYFGYDYYPMLKNDAGTTMQSTYLYCLQMSAELAAKNNCSWEITVQTYAQSGTLRSNTAADVELQMNLALAFGAYNVNYFTYWMWQNKAGWSECFAIMDDYGNKLLYDEVKKVNEDGKQLYKIIGNYTYQKTKLSYIGVSAPIWYKGVKESELDGADFTSDGNVLVNQLEDAKKGCKGYMVVNVSDTAKENLTSVTLSFNGFDSVMAVKDGQTTYKTLNDGKINLLLEQGEGVFLIPYKTK